MAKKNVEVKVIRAREWKKDKKSEPVVFFDLEINGVSIYGCRRVSGKKGDFTAFPSYKGSDGKYYNHVWCKLSEDDEDAIGEAIEKALDDGDDE